MADQWPWGTRAGWPSVPGWYTFLRLLLHKPPWEPDAEDLPWCGEGLWWRVAQGRTECEGQPGETADRLWRDQSGVHWWAKANHPPRIYLHCKACCRRSLCVCMLTLLEFILTSLCFDFFYIALFSHIIFRFFQGGFTADGSVMWPRKGLFRRLLWALERGESSI